MLDGDEDVDDVGDEEADDEEEDDDDRHAGE